MIKEKILVVDDLPDWRTTLSGLLSDAGYDVKIADSSEKALKLFKANPFDLAVLDLRLVDSDIENEDGLILAKKLKTHWPDVKVILITGYGTPEKEESAMEPDPVTGLKPADDYIPKTDTGKLVQTVKKILAQ